MFEVLINAVLFGEVLVSMYVFRRAYFRDWMNIVDLVVTSLCFVFFIVFLIEEEENNKEWEDLSEIDTFLLIFRYAFQIMRLCILVRNGRNRSKILTQGKVDFNSNEAKLMSLAELRSHSGHLNGQHMDQDGEDGLDDSLDPDEAYLDEDYDDEEDMDDTL